MLIEMRRLLLVFTVALATLAVLATPADARRKFGSASSSKSSTSAPAARAPAAAASASKHNWSGPLIGVALARATRARLSKVFELPATAATVLPDGRHFHIGRLKRAVFGGTYVGYVSSTEYVDLPTEKLESLLFSVGFNSVAEFEAHLAKHPPPAVDAADAAAGEPAEAAEASEGRGPLATAALGIGALGLLGFLGYCFVSWRRNAEAAPAATSIAANRAARVVGERKPALQSPPVPSAPRGPVAPQRSVVPRVATTSTAMFQSAPAAPTGPARRAPRDLSALTRKPQPV